MSGPRLTAPASKLARSMSTSSTAKPATLLTTSRFPAPIARQYADLLKERSLEGDHPRHIYTRTANRPHPAPRRMRLMQTFTSSAPNAARSDKSTIDFALLPSSESLTGPSADPYTRIRMPLLPDSFLTSHPPETLVSDAPLPMPEISVIAAHPENVAAVSALSEIEGMTMDGVELKFAHEGPAEEREPGMLTDLWKGLVDDVFGAGGGKGKVAL